MNRAEQAEKTTKALYGGASALGVTDPEFAAIKERLIYGEVYAEEKLSARLRELVILVVATTNQTMNEVKRHTAAALACGVKPEEIKEAVYHCAPPRRRIRRTFRTISPPTASAIFIRESFCPSTSASC